MKLSKTDDGRYLFYCEGCERLHAFSGIWQFNGDLERPTVSPSILVTMTDNGVTNICHSFVTEGAIQYLNDCHHKLAGQTVELLDEEQWYEE